MKKFIFISFKNLKNKFLNLIKNNRKRIVFYSALISIILLCSLPIYQNFIYFSSLNKIEKTNLFFYFISLLLIIFIIFICSFYLDTLVELYLDVDKIKTDFSTSLPEFNFIFSKKFKKIRVFLKNITYIVTIFCIWNYNLYIENIASSMIILFIITIPSLIKINDKGKIMKVILKIFIVSIFISFFPSEKYSYKIALFSPSDEMPFFKYSPYEILLSFFKAILYIRFYIYFEYIIRFISKNLIYNKME